MVERISPWAKDQVELSNLLIEIGWENWASDQRALSIQPVRADLMERTVGSVLYDTKSPIEGP